MHISRLSLPRPVGQRSVLSVLALIVALVVPAAVGRAGLPAFPWHGPSTAGSVAASSSVPARVLAPPALTPVEPMPPKQAYPYGWFGPKPTYHWKRSFGVSKAYTQWSRY